MHPRSNNSKSPGKENSSVPYLQKRRSPPHVLAGKKPRKGRSHARRRTAGKEWLKRVKQRREERQRMRLSCCSKFRACISPYSEESHSSSKRESRAQEYEINESLHFSSESGVSHYLKSEPSSSFSRMNRSKSPQLHPISRDSPSNLIERSESIKNKDHCISYHERKQRYYEVQEYSYSDCPFNVLPQDSGDFDSSPYYMHRRVFSPRYAITEIKRDQYRTHKDRRFNILLTDWSGSEKFVDPISDSNFKNHSDKNQESSHSSICKTPPENPKSLEEIDAMTFEQLNAFPVSASAMLRIKYLTVWGSSFLEAKRTIIKQNFIKVFNRMKVQRSLLRGSNKSGVQPTQFTNKKLNPDETNSVPECSGKVNTDEREAVTKPRGLKRPAEETVTSDSKRPRIADSSEVPGGVPTEKWGVAPTEGSGVATEGSEIALEGSGVTPINKKSGKRRCGSATGESIVSLASTSKGEDKKSYKPWADSDIRVEIVPEGYPEKVINDQQGEAIKFALLRKLDDIPKGGPSQKFFNIRQSRGACVISCADECTKSWLKEIVKEITPWEGAKLAVTHDKNISKPITVSTWIPGVPQMETEVILKRFDRQNAGLMTETWKVLSRKLDPKGQQLILLMDRESWNKVLEVQCRPYINFSRVSFKVLGPTNQEGEGALRSPPWKHLEGEIH